VTEGSNSCFASGTWPLSVTESPTSPSTESRDPGVKGHLTGTWEYRHDLVMETPTKSIEEQSIERVRRLVLAHLRGEDARVYLFGSRSRGDARAGSDIDVGILPRTALTRGLLADLREQLEELAIPYHVDVVNLAETSEVFRKHVLKEASLWRS
jgi:uncharacterized protein